MKTLHLLRHAKSSWSYPELSDRERPLNKRGRRDAPRMGQALANILEPMPVVVSSARRAQQTLEGILNGWPELLRADHATAEELYTFDCDDLLRWIHRQSDSRAQLFLIGHNPALTDLVNRLIDDGHLTNLPTAGYAQLRIHCEHWSDIEADCAQLARHLFPKQLMH